MTSIEKLRRFPLLKRNPETTIFSVDQRILRRIHRPPEAPHVLAVRRRRFLQVELQRGIKEVLAVSRGSTAASKLDEV